MDTWEKLASEESIKKTVEALKKNGIGAVTVDNGAQAKEKVLAMIPQGAEVMAMSSQTVETLGLTAAINESGNYDSVKTKLSKMDRKTQGGQMQKLGAAPTWAVGSVHAVTEDGQVLVASNTGSQLGVYAYAAQHVIWVVGTQKIVKDLDEGRKRVYEYCLVKESARMQKLYNMPSNVSKLLQTSRENIPGRITMILVKEKIGV